MMETLRELEAGYWDQPAFSQREDLKRINELRSQMGLPQVDDKLREPKSQPKAAKKPARDLTRARELIAAYKVKAEELKRHQEYAERVIAATDGPGKTPVEPLATMGCNGGALRCDHCKLPIILEGGNFHGVYADEAWARQSPIARINWVSYIKGGMVVELQSNYTLRIYHGYQHRPEDCCEIARRQDEENRANHKIVIDKELQEELLEAITDLDKYKVYNEIVNTMFGYDPGFGVNHP